MNKLFVKLSITATVCGLLWAAPTLAQNAQIKEPPDLEMTLEDMAILGWTTDTPKTPPFEQFAVAHCGTSPDSMNQEWTSHIRMNACHSQTRWRVRLTGLNPETTYYCTVTSRDGHGNPTSAQSDPYSFTTAPVGQRIVKKGQPQQ